MAQLKFVMDGNNKPTKEAFGMHSKDGEYVDFDKTCMCEGQVSSRYTGREWLRGSPSPLTFDKRTWRVW